MYRAQCFLAMMALCVGVAHSWDIAVSLGDQIIFYTNEGNETDRVRIQERNIGGLAYDVVHNRMLYVDKQNNDAICIYNLSSKENECLIGKSGRNILSIAYDPVTENVFFTDANEKSINWISLKRGYKNNLHENLLIKLDDRTPGDIAVDSCKGYIYWANTGHKETVNDVEKIRFSGTGRKALDIDFDSYDVCSLTIDPRTQKIYYLDYLKKNSRHSLNIADMNGKNSHIKFIISLWSEANELTVSKDYVYFVSATSGNGYISVWRSSKEKGSNIYPDEISKFYTNGSLGLVANYKIDDQIEGKHGCDSLSNLIQTTTEAPGTITCERCDVCVNYCFRGSCSVNDEGLPKCSCNAGYSGERCEVPACLHYCLQGNCSVSDEGHPTCSCTLGYSGERCEVSACHGYCLYDGECSLNEDNEPVCQCAGNHEGARCEAHVTDTTPAYELAKRNFTVADLLSVWGKRSSRTFVTFEILP